jgi:uncharacterized protein (DUF736 family)
MENNKQKSIGALWLQTAKSGYKYFNGKIELDGKEYKIVVFKNENATEENRQPNYRILEQKPLEDNKTKETNIVDDEDDELPF